MKSLNIENRKSTIKGIIANPESQTFETFEIETAYTRSAVKAVELAREALNIPNACMVSVTEIMNEAAKSINYDATSLMEFASDYGHINDYEPKENEFVIPFTMFTYSAQIWAIGNDDTYTTEFFEYESTVKLTKVDARAAVKMAYELENKNDHVIGIHNDTRTEEKWYALITRENLKNVKTK